MVRRIFGAKMDEVTGGQKKLHKDELRNSFSSPIIITIIMSRGMRRTGHVAQIGRRGKLIGYSWESQRERTNRKIKT
jgi:hypothetical protein